MPGVNSSASLSLPLKRLGIRNEPSATLPRPKLSLDKNFLLFKFRWCSNISFSIALKFLLSFLPYYTSYLSPPSWRQGLRCLNLGGWDIHRHPTVLPHPAC